MVVDERPAPLAPKRPHLTGFILFSLALHAALFWWLKPTSEKPQSIRNKPSEVPIQARLVFAPPPVEAQPEEQAPVSQPAEPTSVAAQKTIALPEQVVPEPEPKPEIPPEPAPIVQTPPEPTPNDAPAAQPAPSTDIRSAADMARQHLQQFQQSQQEAMSEQAVREYRTQKASPVIPKPTPAPYMTEDEKFLEASRIRANCEKAGAKTFAMVAGLFGGNIDCNKPSDFQRYIDQRVNKGADNKEK